MDGLITCEKCNENYYSSLTQCPRCGYKKDGSNQNSSEFNIRNPFLELSSTASQNNNTASSPSSSFLINKPASSIGPSNNSFGGNSLVNNNTTMPNMPAADMPVMTNPSVNVPQTSIAGVQTNQVAVANSAVNPIDNNAFVNDSNLPVNQPVEFEINKTDSQKLEDINNFVNQNDYMKSLESNKYQVSGIDFDSFFNTSSEPKEEVTNNDVLAAVPSSEVPTNPVEVASEVSTEVTTEATSEVPSSENGNSSYNPALDFEKDRLEQIRKEENEKNNDKEKEKKAFDLYSIYKFELLLVALITLAVVIITSLSVFNIAFLVHGIFIIAFLVLCYRFASIPKKEAGFIGLFVGALMIATIIYKDYVDFIFGIFIFTSSISYIAKYKK